MSKAFGRIEELYHEALGLQGDARARFLRDACGDDAALQRAVEELLDQPVSAERFLQRSLGAVAAPGTGAAGSLSGRRLGAYQIQALIGTGGMGDVYRAHDSRLGRDVAIKVLPAEWSADRDRLRRFRNEARAAAALNHPHICTIHDVGAGENGEPRSSRWNCSTGTRYRSGSPADRCPSNSWSPTASVSRMHWTRRIPSPSCIAISSRPISASARAAPRSWILVSRRTHRWGIPALETRTTALTAPGGTVGTVAYMSPEQLRGEPLDRRSDLFSLGLVLYEMATGRPAFTGGTASVIGGAILHATPIPPRQLRPELPHTLEQIILKAIDKDREARYQTAAELRSDLQHVQHRLGQPSVIAPAAAAHGASHRSISRRTIALVAALLVLVGGLAVWNGRTGDRTSSAVADASTDGPHRLVVLPFDNVSGQPSDQWLAGAFADALTLGLRDADNLLLVNRARVLELGGTQPALDSGAVDRIVKTLAVRFYVDGTYQRVGDDIRVVARLINADVGTIAMQESRTDRFANLLQLQDDLSRRFATALDESPGIGVKRTTSLAAYQSVAEANDLYLAGHYQEAVERLQRSIQQDDAYAEAWALLGKSYGGQAGPFNSVAGSEFQRKALGASLRAVELSPALYEALVSLALAYRGLFLYEPAAEAAQRAIDINPRLAEAYEVLATLYESSPYGPCARKRDPELAERLFTKALELDPQRRTAHLSLRAHLGWLDRLDEAEQLPIPAHLHDDVGFIRERAAGMLFRKRPDEAEQLIRAAAERAPVSVHDEWVLAGSTLCVATPMLSVVCRLRLRRGRGRCAKSTTPFFTELSATHAWPRCTSSAYSKSIHPARDSSNGRPDLRHCGPVGRSRTSSASIACRQAAEIRDKPRNVPDLSRAEDVVYAPYRPIPVALNGNPWRDWL